MRVAVIDDDKSARTSLARLIKTAGIEVVAFSSAREFLEDPDRNQVDCAVTDVRMPGFDGFALQQNLAQTLPHVSIVFITGHGDVPMSVKAMKLGAVDFLEKPVNPASLIESIRRATERSRDQKASHAQIDDLRSRWELLTPRERQVFQLITSGLLNKQAGAELGTSERTIKVHRGRVMEKLQAESLAELVRMADLLKIRPAPNPYSARVRVDTRSR